MTTRLDPQHAEPVLRIVERHALYQASQGLGRSACVGWLHHGGDLILSVVQAGAALVAVEALKKSEKFSAVTAMLGQNIDRVFRIGAAYRRFVVANQEPLRRIAANTTQLRWMLPHIDRIIQGGTSEHSNPTGSPGPT